MRKIAVGVAILCAAAIFFEISQPASRIGNSPLVQQMSAMRQIGLKLSSYAENHSAAEVDKLKTASIDDLLTMDVISTTDAAYLHDRQIAFRGYDPADIGDDVPLLEGIYRRGSTRIHIICYSDIHVVTSPLEPTK